MKYIQCLRAFALGVVLFRFFEANADCPCRHRRFAAYKTQR